MSALKLLLVDGHALIHRGFHALPDLRTRRTDEPTGAIYGFASMLLQALRDQGPTHAAMALDHPAPTFRHEQFPEYKAQRPTAPPDLHAQIPRVRQLAEAFGLAIYEVPGYEADDTLGALAQQALERSFEVLIATGDADTLQLVRPGVTVMMPGRAPGEVRLYDGAGFHERYGFGPTLLPDYKALRGDSSDNIPGVPGVGEKTATRLLQEFGSLEALYERLEEVSPPKLREALRAHEGQAQQSKVLATIVTELPVTFEPESCSLQRLDRARVLELFQELEFASLLPRFQGIALEERVGARSAVPLRQDEPRVAVTREHDYRIIRDLAALEALRAELAGASLLAVDTETTGQEPLRCELVGISLSAAPGRAAYVPVGHQEAPALTRELVLGQLRPLLEDPQMGKVAHNAKFDVEVLAQADISLGPMVFDTMLAAQLLGEKAINLKALVFNRLGIEMTPITQLIGPARRGQQLTMDQVPLEDAGQYACADADMTGRLRPLLEADLREQGMWELFTALEMPLLPVLVTMERTGVALDTALLRSLSQELSQGVASLERRIYEAVGHHFTINSPQQLGRLLFEELRLPHFRRTKTGYSTDAAVLEELRGAHPVVELVLEHRQLTKLLSTYLDTLPTLIDPATGRVHTSYNQIGSATGRISSSDPNLQNIPIRGETGAQVRFAFVGRGPSPPGKDEPWQVLSADYSQIELRVLAHITHDPGLTAAFLRDEDIHAATAARVFGVPLQGVTTDMRRKAKEVNFGIAYGMSEFGLAQRLRIERDEAHEIITAYFTQYPGVQVYIEETKALAHQQGYLQTLLGRRRAIPEIHSPNAQARQAAERAAINTPIQGSAADILKLAMLRVHDRLRQSGLRARLLMTVHDELVFEVPQDEAKALQELAVEAMGSAYPLAVPLKVDVSVGRTWGG